MPSFDKQQPTRAKISAAPPQNPESLQLISFFEADICDVTLLASSSILIPF
jgi:hypothetical protein